MKPERKFPILQYFANDQTDKDKRYVSERFAQLAVDLANIFDGCPEGSVCLRKLLESRDCAMRIVEEGPPLELGLTSNPVYGSPKSLLGDGSLPTKT